MVMVVMVTKATLYQVLGDAGSSRSTEGIEGIGAHPLVVVGLRDRGYMMLPRLP